MAFTEFSIESAITPVMPRKSVKLDGMSGVARIYRSNSKSTEEFIMGAVNDLGSADRCILYANSSMNALSDRLHEAGKIAKAVNTAKSRGVESFSNVPYLNPWEYAIEGKVGEFFKKIWDAIRTACRKLVSMIANFIRWLGNLISSADTKRQIKDYDFYKSHKAQIDKYSKAAKVGQAKFNSVQWKVDANGLSKLITSALSHFLSAIRAKKQDLNILQNAARTDLGVLHDEKDFANVYSKVFGISEAGIMGVVGPRGVIGGGQARFYERAKHHVSTIIDEINKDLDGAINKLFGQKASGGHISAKSLVSSAVSKGEGVGQITCEAMRKLSGDFSCLSAEWLSKNVKGCVAAAHANQKVFAEYTNCIDQVAKRFDKVTDSKYGSLAQLTAQLANARIRYNSFYSSLMLELETAAMRFRKSAHIALKQYIKAGNTGAPKGKSEEEYRQPMQSVEELFDFS